MTRRGIAALALGIVLLLSACTGDETPPPRETTRRTPSDGNRLEWSAEPLWRGDTNGLPGVMRSGFRTARSAGGLTLLEWGSDTIAVVDSDTGRPAWTASREPRTDPTAKNFVPFNPTGRAPVATIAGDAVLFAGYFSDGEQSTAALRLSDGEPLWLASGEYGVADADDHLVVVRLGEQPHTRALDATTGVPRWDAPGLWPRFVAGNRVLTEISSKEPDQDADDSTLVALDAESGKQVWSLVDRYTRSEVAFVAGDVALVYARAAGEARDRVVVLDASTGAEITRLGWDWGARTTCATDHTAVIACTLDKQLDRYAGLSGRLVTFDVRSRQSHPAPAKDLRDTEVTAVWDGYVFVRAHHTTWAVDRDGARASADLPGDLIGIDDRHLVVLRSGSTSGIASYALD
jgi:outer membrane protein assembly factor BamB